MDNTQQALQQALDFIRDGMEFGYIEDAPHRDWRKVLRDLDAALSLPVEAPSERRPLFDPMFPEQGYVSDAEWARRRASPSKGIAGDAAAQEPAVTETMLQAGKRAWDEYVEHVPARVALTRIYLAMEAAKDSFHLAGGSSQSVREQAVAYWECRSFDIEHGVWFPWGRVEGSARYPLEQRLADIRAKIAEGSRWELRALYASSLPAPSGLLDRVKAAEQRVQDNRAPRSIPADARDVDLVLAEVRYWLEGNWPPFWIKDAALHQAHQKGGA